MVIWSQVRQLTREMKLKTALTEERLSDKMLPKLRLEEENKREPKKGEGEEERRG